MSGNSDSEIVTHQTTGTAGLLLRGRFRHVLGMASMYHQRTGVVVGYTEDKFPLGSHFYITMTGTRVNISQLESWLSDHLNVP